MSEVTTLFRGILAIGNSKNEAINRYRLLARGKGVSVFTDESQSTAFISNSASGPLAELFNPLTGDMDIVQAQDLLDSLDFESKSSDADVEVSHYECVAGCGSHLIHDDEELVKFCPVCASEVSLSEEAEEDDLDVELTDEEDDSEEDADDADDSEDESEDADDSEDESEEDADDSEADSDDEPLVIAADSLEDASRIYVKHKARHTSLSSGRNDFNAEYVLCSNTKCGAHIVSDIEVNSCPACESSVKDPKKSVLSSAISISSEDEEDLDLSYNDDDDLGVDDLDLDDEASESSDCEDIGDCEDKDEADLDEADLSDDDVSESDDDVDDEIEDEETTDVDVDSLDDVDDTSESSYKLLEAVYCGSLQKGAQWLALYDGVPVASVSREDAGNNKDIFDTATFGNVVLASAKHAGIKTTLKELGFRSFSRTIPVPVIVERLCSEKIAEATDALDEQKAHYAERLQSALATAAIGLNRGFFVNAKNPLKDALHSALSSSGIRNPDTIIANVFRDHADMYHKALFARANDILKKPEEVQVSLAKTVLETNYSESSSNNGQSVEDRLGNMGTVTASTPAPTNVSEATVRTARPIGSLDQINKVVAGLGRRR